MPDGKEVLNDLDFDSSIKLMKQRELLEFVARQAYGLSKDISHIRSEVTCNKTRSIVNRFAIIALILVLIALGVLETGWLEIF